MPLIYVLEVAVGIGFLIFIHELGHFLVAKFSKVKVERFSLGFGPELVGFTGGDTRYSIRAVPLGGYVKMQGDEPGQESAQSEGSFLAQGFRTKALIILAGSGMNILSALVLFVAVFRIGITFPAARVGGVEYGSSAYYAGIETGDRIAAIDGDTDIDFYTLATEAALADPGQVLALVVERDGRRLDIDVYPEFNSDLGMGAIGVGPYQTLKIESLEEIAASEEGQEPRESIRSPLAAAGIEPGWTITAFNGEKLDSVYEFEKKAFANGLKPFNLTVVRGSVEKSVEVKPVRNPTVALGIGAANGTEVASVTEDGIAYRMGLREGDDIVALGDQPASNLHELSYLITKSVKELPFLRVKRGDLVVDLEWSYRPASGYEFITRGGFETVRGSLVDQVLPYSPAEVLGIQPGDRITAVDGKEVKEFGDIRPLLEAAEGDSITVQWNRGGETFQGTFEPVFLGLVPGVETIERRLGLAGACRIGVSKAWDFASQIYLLLRKAFTGQSTITRNLQGPVGIARTSYQFAKEGLVELLFFIAIIGINLGVVNLLPIPILDGGLLVIFAVEKIKGSPLSANTQAVLQYIGLAMIAVLFIFVTFNDIMRLLGLR